MKDKCLMSVSYYGAILVNTNNEVEWEITYKDNDLAFDGHSTIPDKLCGVDYDPVSGRILIGFRYYFLEVDWNKNILWKYQFLNPYGIHSVFYTLNKDVIVSSAVYDKVSIISRKTQTSIFDWVGKSYHKDGLHVNYARQYGDFIYISTIKGFFIILNRNKDEIFRTALPEIDSPHSFIPLFDRENEYLAASTGNGKIIRFDRSGVVNWEYEVEDIIVPKKQLPSKRPHIKYSKGAHQIDYVGKDHIMIALPNHRLVRVINWNKEVLKEWKMPKHLWEGHEAGVGPRCPMAKLI